jgi:hypothetical protein
MGHTLCGQSLAPHANRTQARRAGRSRNRSSSPAVVGYKRLNYAMVWRPAAPISCYFERRQQFEREGKRSAYGISN